MDVYDDEKVWIIGYKSLIEKKKLSQAKVSEMSGIKSSYMSTALGENKTKPLSEKARKTISDKVFNMTREEVEDLGKTIFKENLRLTELDNVSDEKLGTLPLIEQVDNFSNAISNYSANLVNKFRKVAEAAQEYKSKYFYLEMLLDDLEVGIKVVDTKTRINYVNRAYNNLVGGNQQIGKTRKDVCDDPSDCIVDKVLKTGEPQSKFLYHQKKWLAVAATPPGPGSDLCQVFITCRDVTESHSKALEDEKKKILCSEALAKLNETILIFDDNKDIEYANYYNLGDIVEHPKNLAEFNMVMHETFKDAGNALETILDTIKTGKTNTYKLTSKQSKKVTEYTVTKLDSGFMIKGGAI